MNRFINLRKKYLDHQHGLSLVELLVVLALLPIALTLGFMFLSFGTSTFATGEKQVDIQQNARLAADFITKELRIAEKVILVDSHSDLAGLGLETEGEYFLYYLYDESGEIFYQKVEEGSVPQAIQEGITDKIEFVLNFRLGDESDILNFDLTAEEKQTGRTYQLETEVLVLNVDVIDDRSSGSGKAVLYQIPAPPNPAIKDIRLEPHSHLYNESQNTIVDVAVYTSNVSDGTVVKAEFYFIDEDGNESLTTLGEKTALIQYNRANFLFTLTPSLLFGDYLISIDVEGLEFPVRRYYYIYPVIENIIIDEKKGIPHHGSAVIITKGVPAGTEALIELVDKDDEESVINFNYHSGDNIVKETGKIEFDIKIDVDDADKDLVLVVTIGKTTVNSSSFLLTEEDPVEEEGPDEPEVPDES
jgi:prepilin-type N-terminal cleavage/methylation domain-containing protein